MSGIPQHTKPEGKPEYFEDGDEIPDLSQEQINSMWECARPVLKGVGGPVIVGVAPVGENPFYRIYKNQDERTD